MMMTMTGNLHPTAGTWRSIQRSGVGLVLAMLLLTGCPATTVSTLSATAAQGVSPAIQLVADKAANPLNRPSGGTVPAAPTAMPDQVASLPTERLEPEALVGLDQTQTTRLLGAPAATEEEAPARVWRYARGGCTLKVFFFMDMTSQDFRALSYDMTSSHNVPDDDQRCFAHLVAQAWDDRRD
ncbi:hypothetical protein [Azospirillum oleiclasticum]|nr:hypothetical protein [Azospirillum oleiclasticum]